MRCGSQTADGSKPVPAKCWNSKSGLWSLPIFAEYHHVLEFFKQHLWSPTCFFVTSWRNLIHGPCFLGLATLGIVTSATWLAAANALAFMCLTLWPVFCASLVMWATKVSKFWQTSEQKNVPVVLVKDSKLSLKETPLVMNQKWWDIFREQSWKIRFGHETIQPPEVLAAARMLHCPIY